MKKISGKFRKEKNFVFLLLIIVILGSIPRSIEIISGNFLFGYDHGVFFQAVKEIVVNHKLTLIGTEVGGGGFFQGPGWYYLLSIPFYLWKGDPYGGMILMLMSGILTVALSVIFGRKIFDAKTALTIGFLVAISPAIIAQSRFIWPPFIVSLLAVFFIFFLYNIFQGAGKFFILLTFIMGLMFHFETATGATLLLQLLIISPLFFIKKMVSVRFFILGLLSFLLTQISLFIFDLRHDFLNVKGMINLFMNGKEDSSIDRINLIANHIGVFRSNFLSSFQMTDLLWPFLLIVLVIGLIAYFRDEKIKGKIEAIDYIYKDAEGKKFGLLTFTPPVYTYAYDYLIWWYGNKNYNYIPHKEKKGIFYLLMETDPSKPWSYEGWLETVIKTGTILKTKELPSGFVVQKRINTK